MGESCKLWAALGASATENREYLSTHKVMVQVCQGAESFPWAGTASMRDSNSRCRSRGRSACTPHQNRSLAHQCCLLMAAKVLCEHLLDSDKIEWKQAEDQDCWLIVGEGKLPSPRQKPGPGSMRVVMRYVQARACKHVRVHASTCKDLHTVHSSR